MKELPIEQRLIERVERDLNGRAPKFKCEGEKGWPDRIVFLPGGRVIFVECKRPRNGRLSLSQKRKGAWLAKHGFAYYVISNYNQIDDFIKHWGSKI